MAAVLFNIEPLREALEHDTLVLTANNRQRNQILRAFHQFKAQQQGLKVWPQPRILSLRQWIEQQWQALLLNGNTELEGTIANSWQSLALWEQVIAGSNAGRLLRQRELASTAESARQSLDAWCCPDAELLAASEHRPNAGTFISWLAQYRQALTRCQLVSPEQAQTLLLRAFISGELTPETNALLYGFDNLTPLAQRLLDGALPNATQVNSQLYKQTLPVRCALNDFDAEVRAAAHWADTILAATPEAVIGIVVPDLGQQRSRVERIFKEIFEPLACQPGKPRTVAPFNFSSGTPLGSAAVIRTALDWLAFALQAQPIERICRLLNNDFWGDSSTERALRAALIKRIRHTGRQKLSIANLRYLLEQLTQKHPELESGLSRQLQIASEIERERHHKHNLSHWLERAMGYLDQLGWPGTRALDSIEFQQIKQWYELHNELLSLTQVQPLFSLYEVTDLLRRSADKTHFQAQTPDSPIQILGALEASGLSFSHCWILGMNHRAWPPAPAPNPLLPINLQRDWQMPNASAERELAYAARLTENFKHCAPQVVFSHGANADDQPLKPSSLITELSAIEPQALGITGESMRAEYYRLLTASGKFEAVDCRYGPALSNPKVRGGAGLFKAQATCPFIAFVRYRLGASSPSEATLGFSAIERGNVLHDALAEVWQQLQNSAALATLTNDALKAIVVSACSNAVNNTGKSRGAEIGAMFRQLETERLTQLLGDWLALERTREPFVIQEIETQHTLNFEGLELSVRVDRIDQLEGGNGPLIIDYKTGQVNTANWQNHKFTDPQLPLYACTLAEGGAQAIAFAQINANALRFAGLGHATGIDGIEDLPDEQWREQLDDWQRRLAELAQEFRDAWAVVDYRNKSARAYDSELEGLTRADELTDISQWLQTSGACLP
ncbi:PD-(D/E)XK nuclease family protein [Gilvimarinus polysaccharolyticus]|uniref:PD-(D/E)XK nuclease family protein n=1 Tax=Gilvimarinus polysaccharolyticus TaxID=863921 RepID=UPI0006732CEB|nr:PD-(D/E)XK nuclease family protein [Gilvimarinus polysaccharolyticus]